MFGIIFFWTPSHFWALSLKYENDYRAAGIPMLPVVAGQRSTLDLILWYSAVAVGVSFLLIPATDMGWIYAVFATIAGVGIVAFANRLRSDRSIAMRYFGFTNVYLAAVFLAMLIDRVVLDEAVGGVGFWFSLGSLLTLGGLALVATVERRKGMRAPGVTAVRHAAEVGITVLVGVLLVAGTWWAAF